MGPSHRTSASRDTTTVKMAANYSWDNRIKFLVRYLYDLDNNGYLNKNDFDCLAVKFTVMEGRGEWSEKSFTRYSMIMCDLWDQISEIADLNKDGAVTIEEFQTSLKNVCQGKEYDDLPSSFKQWIVAMFNTIDTDGDGFIGLDEYRYDCVNRQAVTQLQDLDKAFKKIAENGGVTRTRYQQLFAQFLGDTDPTCDGCFLFGPLPLVK